MQGVEGPRGPLELLVQLALKVLLDYRARPVLWPQGLPGATGLRGQPDSPGPTGATE